MLSLSIGLFLFNDENDMGRKIVLIRINYRLGKKRRVLSGDEGHPQGIMKKSEVANGFFPIP